MTEMNSTSKAGPSWQEAVFGVFKAGGVQQIAYVPDAGHSHVIRSAIADPGIEDVVLTTEEEGVALVCGAWLGGQRAVLLMQSSGVGNCVNMFSLLRAAIHVLRADHPEGAAEIVSAGFDAAFEAGEKVAVLLGQGLIGRKTWGRK